MPSCEKIDTSRRGLIAKNIFLRAFFKSHFFGQTRNFNERKFLNGFCYGNKFDVFLHSWSQWQNFCNCTQTWIRMGLDYQGLWKFPFSAFKTVELLNPKNLTKPCLVKYFLQFAFIPGCSGLRRTQLYNFVILWILIVEYVWLSVNY